MKLVRSRLTASNFPIFLVSVGTIGIAAVMLIHPADFNETSISRQYPGWQSAAWLIYFSAAGIITLAGILSNHRHLEGGGAFLLAAAYLIDALAIFVEREVAGFLSGGLIAIAALGIATRGVIILHESNQRAKEAKIIAEG